MYMAKDATLQTFLANLAPQLLIDWNVSPQKLSSCDASVNKSWIFYWKFKIYFVPFSHLQSFAPITKISTTPSPTGHDCISN